MSDLYLKQLLLGPMENFVYLVGSRSAKKCYAVDPAWDVAAIRQAATEDGMELVGALVTHYHPDHCGGHLWGHDIEGVAELAHGANIPVHVHQDELEGVMKVTGLSKSDCKVCHGGDTLRVGQVELTVIHTPGHTPGSQCFLARDAAGQSLISGDTLFISGCGRVDLPGGNSEQLFESLTTKLAKLPAETTLYPGHNYDSEPHLPLGDVRRLNPYLKIGSLADWRRLRGM
jgi:hydroxyacylglutathione hydrolase